jgi:hypothetical protein
MTPIPAETQVRALTSASSLYRRVHCPGSENAERDQPNLDSPFSAEGRMLHDLDAYPEKPRDHLTESQRGALDRNQRLRDAFFSAQHERLAIDPDEERVRIVEQEFFLCDAEGEIVRDPFGGQPFPGHPDVIEYFPRLMVALVTDSKFGRYPVDRAEINYQLRCYASMFSDQFPCVRIVAGITQPWVSAPDDFHSVEYVAEDFPRVGRPRRRAVRRSPPACTAGRSRSARRRRPSCPNWRSDG